MTPTDPRHGTQAGYTAGCRAECCLRAAVRYTKQLRLDQQRGVPSRKVSAVGTRRRVHALARLGWPIAYQASRIGVSTQALQHSISEERAHVFRARHDEILALYAELSMKVGYSTSSASRAKAKGWAPPLAWDDIDNPDARPRGSSSRVQIRKPGVKTPGQRKAAHAAYARGERTPDVVAGEKEYQRLRPDKARPADEDAA